MALAEGGADAFDLVDDGDGAAVGLLGDGQGDDRFGVEARAGVALFEGVANGGQVGDVDAPAVGHGAHDDLLDLPGGLELADGANQHFFAADLETAARYEPAEYLPYGLGDAVTSIDEVGRTETEIEVAAKAVRVATTERILGIVKDAGLRLTELTLTSTALGGVVASVVTQRTPEIGVRLALGARAVDVLALVMRGGAWMAAAGGVLGLAGALAVHRVVESVVVNASGLDPMPVLTAGLFLAAAVIGASYVPARRAIRIDPTTALRE